MDAEASQIDHAILAAASREWRKQAFVVATVVMNRPAGAGTEWRDVEISLGRQALVAAGKLEAAGNLSRMGYSEVRLPGPSASPPA